MATGWQNRWREQSRLKQGAAAVLLVSSTANLIVNLAYPDSRERRVIQLIWSLSMIAWSVVQLLDYRTKRRAEQNTL